MIKVETLLENFSLDGAKRRLLLHVCCAPCASGVLPRLADAADITLYYYNPNILPKDEFIRRLDALNLLLIHFPAVKLIVPEQTEQEFRAVAEGLENLPEGGARCTECFRLRLNATARYFAAHKNEYDCFASTLTVSPHKNAALINEIGRQAEEKYGAVYAASDFKKRDGYLTSVRLSKEYGLYRQTYCGCGFPAR